MTTPSPTPTIVIVQGSFQRPEHYKKLSDSLRSLGCPVEQPELPSCTNTEAPDFPNTTLADDAAAVQKLVAHLVEEQGKVVVIACHSYGGLVTSEAIPQELTLTRRQREGKRGGVAHLFFFAAFLLDEGQSVRDVFGKSPDSDIRPDGRCAMKNAREMLYNDLAPTEAEYYASIITLQSYKVQETKLTRAAYKYSSSTYLITEDDRACPPAYQEGFAQQANSRIERCQTGHSPMLVAPGMLADKIASAAQQAVGVIDR